MKQSLKALPKKLLAVFLALLTCLALLPSALYATSVSAEETTITIINLPRGGGTGWETNEVHLMNGWVVEANNHFPAISIGGENGQVAYCIQPGAELHTGSSLTQYGEDYWDTIPSNSSLAWYDVQAYIGRVMRYGYQGTNSLSWNASNPDHANAMGMEMATHVLIWEVLVGERDENFNKVDAHAYGCNNVLEMFPASYPIYNYIISNYNAIVTAVQSHVTIPSFMTNRTATATTVEMTWNANNQRYEAVLTDTNNVLGNFSFSTSDSSVSCSVAGNQLTVYSNNAPSGDVSITATKNAQSVGSVVWSDGIVNPNTGDLQDVVTYSATINDPLQAYINVKVSTGSLNIIKTAEDGNVAGIRMNISGNGINQDVTTGPDGSVRVDGLTPGTYTVTEYPSDIYVPQDPQQVTVISGQTVEVTFNNTLKRGTLSVTKSSEDGLVEGVTFRLTGKSSSGQIVDVTAVTDASGVAVFKDVLIGENFTLTEVDTGIQYVVPADQTATINWDEVTNATVNNILKKWTATIVKVDAETGETAQGDATLAGAVYGVYKGEELVDTYTTDANGTFTTQEYICGSDWSIREISPSQGYLLDETVHHVGAEPELYTIEHNAISMTMSETSLKGSIALIKHSDDGETGMETPETGAQFEVYLTSAGSYASAKETERDLLTCDENGFAQSKALPYGTYTVHQIQGWEGTEFVSDFTVFINTDGQVYRFLLNNRPFESYLKVVKVDAETGVAIPYAGAGFQIYRSNGSKVEMTIAYPTPTTIDTFYTNSEGYLVTPQVLDYGDFDLVEIQAPYGYVLDSTPVPFTISEENASEEDGLTVVQVTKTDMPQKGTITVTKTGEIFSSVSASGDVYQPVWADGTLSGAEFAITAAEDIITPDGTLRYAAGTVVDTITTGPDGAAVSIPLYLGKYNVTETKVPEGMIANDTVYSVELTYAGQNVEVTNTNLSVDNQRQTVSVELSKVMERDETFGLGDNDVLSVRFGLYAAEDIVAADGSVIPEDGLIEIVSVSEDGSASFASDLPFGSYYVKEISTDEHYILDGTEHPFEFTYHGDDVETVHIDLGEFTNDLIRGNITGLKINRETGETIAGAVFGLFAADETEFTVENSLVDPVTSSSEGIFEFLNIPYGNFIVHELSPAPNYLPNDTNYPITISKDTQVIEIEVVNDLIPELGTTATVDGGKETHPGIITLDDVVSYKHLVPGQEYTVMGTLMDKATGQPFLDANGNEVTFQATFVPENPTGEAKVTFVFDASHITVNTDVVAFESLYKDGIELAVHADIEDEGQTITIKVPKIHTTASIDGSKEVTADGVITIQDVVDYEDLIPGKEYTLSGVLMNKATGEPFLVDGQPVRMVLTFVPQSANGSVTMYFTFDSSVVNSTTDVVVFETMTHNGNEVAIHADIEDEGQTVTITVPAPVPQTGDNAHLPIAMALGGLLLSLAAGGYIFFLLRCKRN